MDQTSAPILGQEHWTHKGDVKLFLWEKRTPLAEKRGTLVFVHGSSMASTPGFDFQMPGKADASMMDWFARRGFDTWCIDMEGYGRSSKHRDINCDVANGADDLEAAIDYMVKTRGTDEFLFYGSSSGALRAALYAQRHPERVARLVLSAFVWTGKGSPTLAERTKKLPEYLANNRRKIDRAFVQTMFTRDHDGGADQAVIDAYAAQILALDDSVPTGTYVDMCAKLPLVDPLKITAPTLIMRGQYDGIAAMDDLLEFFKLLPNADKQFAVMPGIAHNSTKAVNYAIAYHILLAFLTQPAPLYRG